MRTTLRLAEVWEFDAVSARQVKSIKTTTIPAKEEVISALQEYFGVTLHQLPRKKILYNGKLADGSGILVCTPESKLYPNGHGWIDFTTIQVSILDEAVYSVLAIRIEGNKIYYLDFRHLKPFLIEKALFNNEHEGDHWKLYIWSTHIQILRNDKNLQINPNSVRSLKARSINGTLE